MNFTIYLTRHGQTMINKYRRLQGWCDSPLTEKGIADAKIAGKHLSEIKFDAAYSSDTLRAMKTRDFILSENQNEIPQTFELMNFREQNFGYFEGADAGQTWTMAGLPHDAKTYYEIIDKLGFAATRDLLHETDPFHDAENDKTFVTRINQGFDYLRKHHQNGENILLVSHSLTIRTIVNQFAPKYNAPVNGPQNGSITKLKVSDNDVIVEYYNHYLDGEEY
ncbi:histidine phosphatase family protein [Ligilactobacillus cholophilus]|uniref:histidine phosphatase family protein n=1 Tax=Ligilactobacillus cholophilus TaxID=3050131 RepID=UPI0025B20B6B|nr:histidine phosphatase family protein [Ligilactobacillus cholophilus]